MFHQHYRLGSAILLSLLFITGCEVSRSSPTAPTPADAPDAAAAPVTSFLGTWRSEPAGSTAAVQSVSASTSAVPELRACRNFQWEVGAETATSISGVLSVECADGISLSANATGTVASPSTLGISVSGSADVPGAGACSFTLNGTGLLVDQDTLKIDYTGTTCLGPVGGSTTLYRDRLFPQPPAPEPTPAEPPAPPAPQPPPPPPPPSIPCASGDGQAIVSCVERTYPDRLVAHVSLGQRQANMAFLRDRIIEAGICGGLDLAWNLKRGVGPHSIDALAWRHPNGAVDVVDIGAAYDDTGHPLRLSWQIVAGPPGYDPYPHPGCR